MITAATLNELAASIRNNHDGIGERAAGIAAIFVETCGRAEHAIPALNEGMPPVMAGLTVYADDDSGDRLWFRFERLRNGLRVYATDRRGDRWWKSLAVPVGERRAA